MDHRWGNRIAVDLPVSIGRRGTMAAGRLRNISISGAYVETLTRLPTLAMVNLRIGGGNGGNPPMADLWGYVMRHDGRGIGIEWCEEVRLQAGRGIALVGVLVQSGAEPHDTPHAHARLPGARA